MSSTYAPMTYGERLEQALRGAGKSRRDLAGQLGISVQAVGQVINGNAIAMSAENNARAAVFLGCSGYWLATGDMPPLTAQETGAVYAAAWPLQGVSPSTISALPTAQKEILEAVILRALGELRAADR